MGVCFVDTETTGLDPDRHAIWEVALITPDGDEHVWQFPVDEMAADPFALEVGHYWERRWVAHDYVDEIDAIFWAHTPKSRREDFLEEGRAISPSATWCGYFRDLTAGHHLCGAVPSFDEERLRRLLHRHGVLHRWHYRVIDVEALAVGFISAAGWTDGGEQVELPWRSDDLSRACGVEPPSEDERHTALGDARWAKRLYERICLTPHQAASSPIAPRQDPRDGVERWPEPARRTLLGRLAQRQGDPSGDRRDH